MPEDGHSIEPVPGGELSPRGEGGNPILSQMARDLLARDKETEQVPQVPPVLDPEEVTYTNSLGQRFHFIYFNKPLFWMSFCPVSELDYAIVMGEMPSGPEGISEFCQRLTLGERSRGLSRDWVYRLPTEDESSGAISWREGADRWGSPIASEAWWDEVWSIDAGDPFRIILIKESRALPMATYEQSGDEEATERPMIYPGDAVVHFPCPNLEAVVREELRRPKGDLTRKDMLFLVNFEMEDKGITDLSGLEHAINLTLLDIWADPWVDPSCIDYAGDMGGRHVSAYNQVDLTPLANLTNLTTLCLGSLETTIFDDLTPLAGLTNLTELNLGYNQITDVSPLMGLTQLVSLSLGNNPMITDEQQAMLKKALPNCEISF